MNIYINLEKTIGNIIEGNHTIVVELGHRRWNEFVASNPAPYVPSPKANAEELASIARSKRNTLLTTSDWTQLPDAPVDQQAWATYRQELRDITSQDGFPEAVVWPVAP